MFRSALTDIKELKEGNIVSGIVRNSTDSGLKNDGLIHIFQMSEKRISHPLEVLSVNQQLSCIRVVEVGVVKGKGGLS